MLTTTITLTEAEAAVTWVALSKLADRITYSGNKTQCAILGEVAAKIIAAGEHAEVPG